MAYTVTSGLNQKGFGLGGLPSMHGTANYGDKTGSFATNQMGMTQGRDSIPGLSTFVKKNQFAQEKLKIATAQPMSRRQMGQ